MIRDFNKITYIEMSDLEKKFERFCRDYKDYYVTISENPLKFETLIVNELKTTTEKRELAEVYLKRAFNAFSDCQKQLESLKKALEDTFLEKD